MPDALDVLRGGDRPVRPTPGFAARLRLRLAEALSPEGVAVTATVDPTPEAVAPPPGGPGALTPYLAVAGAAAALDWYVRVFGARVVEPPVVMPDGRIGHAALELAGGARLMLSEEHPEIGVVAPVPGGGSAVTLHLTVPDVDGLVARAAAAGAEVERPPLDQPYGRQAVIRDPFAHRWMLMGARSGAGRRPGDIVYASLNLPDADRAARFYAAVLGWRYEPAAAGRSRQVVGQALHHGIWGTDGPPTLFLCFAVADLDAALAAVAAAGGEPGVPADEPYGLVADCHDDQGVAFALYQLPQGVAAVTDRPVAGPGDLAYVTMQVVDASRARAFYGAVLGWEFTPGRVDDGWNVTGVDPMVGVSGGHPEAVTVPVYAVEDAAAAAGRARAAGGTAGPVQEQGYGRLVDCSDDQGTRFSLVQLGGAGH